MTSGNSRLKQIQLSIPDPNTCQVPSTMLYWVAVEGCRRVFAQYMDDGTDEDKESAATAAGPSKT